MKSSQWFDLVNAPGGIALGVTFEGTGAGTAKIYPNGRIILTLTTAAQVSKYVKLTTPYAMKVLDAFSIHGNATACTWAVANGSSNIIDAVTVAASDTDIDRALDIDDAYNTFASGDNDLQIDIATAGFLGVLVIDTQLL